MSGWGAQLYPNMSCSLKYLFIMESRPANYREAPKWKGQIPDPKGAGRWELGLYTSGSHIVKKFCIGQTNLKQQAQQIQP